MTCPVCGYHSGLRSPSQLLCPRVHLVKDIPVPADRDWEVPSSAYGNDAPDVEPKDRCPHCVGGSIGSDICPRCWGSSEGEAD